jgi:hypothetical protein
LLLLPRLLMPLLVSYCSAKAQSCDIMRGLLLLLLCYTHLKFFTPMLFMSAMSCLYLL